MTLSPVIVHDRNWEGYKGLGERFMLCREIYVEPR